MTEDKKEPQALSEIKSLRGEKRKVYRAGDRCFKAGILTGYNTLLRRGYKGIPYSG